MNREPMNWQRLLSAKRLGCAGDAGKISVDRTPFQRDFDRIVFSSSFRRMQDKTQVFPLAEHGLVRTRLTHCMETSSIARSLGSVVGASLWSHDKLENLHPSDFGGVLAAAALAHDIGNPPLGHGGEESIRHWFTHSSEAARIRDKMSPAERADFEYYEGNAQGFRLLTRLEMPDQIGGMRLTCATLGTFAKYPYSSSSSARPTWSQGHKYNFFQAEKGLFAEVARETGLIQFGEEAYCRHPLAFLLEAADDIAYRVVDFEDAHSQGLIDYSLLEEHFLRLLEDRKVVDALSSMSDNMRRVEYLRALVIGKLVRGVTAVFMEHEEELLNAEYHKPLLEQLDVYPVLCEIQKISTAQIYNNIKVAEIIAAGFELVSGMLDILVPAVEELAEEKNGGHQASYRSRRLASVIPVHFMRLEDPEWRGSAYLRLLNILDYLSGMTDSYAVALFKKMKGISW